MQKHVIKEDRNKNIKRLSAIFVATIMILTTLTTMSLFVSQAEAAPTWPDAYWAWLSDDKNEDGTNDDYRDVNTTYYYFDEDYLYLRMYCRAIPSFAGKDSRYKWFFDLHGDAAISGGNTINCEYQLFVEDTTDDGDGELYWLYDTNADGSFNEWDGSPYDYTTQEVTDTSIANWRITGNNVDFWIARENFTDPAMVWLLWATDQKNPNLDQAPKTDRPDNDLFIPFEINEAPVANDDYYETPEDTPLNVPADGVLTNDIDPEDDQLNASKISDPSNGTLTAFNQDGSFTYVPDDNWCGVDSFTYVANDSFMDSNIATVYIDVTCVNDIPVANDDYMTVAEGGTQTILDSGDDSVLDNDTDPDGDTLTASLTTGPAHAAAFTLSPDGTFSYTHDGTETATDSFVYQACDDDVTPACDTATAYDDYYTVDEDSTDNYFDVLYNDTDPEDDMLDVMSFTTPSNGTVTNHGTHITYTPTADYCGTDEFNYTISDGYGGYDTATVYVIVTCGNDAPVAHDDYKTVAEDSTNNIIDVLANDADVDGDTLNVFSFTTPSHGSVQNHGTHVTYTPTADYCDSDQFDYTITDGNGGYDTATVYITINCGNDCPTARPDSYITNEDTPLTITAPGVLNNDDDPDSDPLTATKLTDPENGTLTYFRSNGSFRYMPNPNWFGTDSFTYEADDGICTDWTTVTIDVYCVNDAPVANDDYYSTGINTLLTVPEPGVLANDLDIDGDDIYAFYEYTLPSNGMLAHFANGSFKYSPDTGFDGTDSFTYRVIDDPTCNDDPQPSNIATVYITISDSTPPIQTFEFGKPIEHNVEFLGNYYDRISCATPIWINSTDPGGSGSWKINYKVWWNDTVPPLFRYEKTVYDGGVGDEDGEQNGEVHVKIYMAESCFHEIWYQCWDYAENTDGIRDVDFIVDCEGPTVTKEVGQPQYPQDVYPNFVSDKTPIWFNATDKGCLPGGTGVCKIIINVWIQDYFVPYGATKTLIDTIVVEDGEIGKDLDPDEGEISYIFHFEEDCCHELEWWGVDCLGTIGTILKQKHYVDLQPPNITKILPGHGYDEICPDDPHTGYLKAGENITLIAEDNGTYNPCVSGLEALFFRYEWENNEFPYEGETSDWLIVNGSVLADTYGWDNPDIEDHWWYRVNDGYANISWDDECRHDLYYFAKDNVWNYGEIYHQVYYVDEYHPDIKLEFPDHGYEPINETHSYIKGKEPFYFNASDDFGCHEECRSGIESIFWRYDFEDRSYPISCDAENVISGMEIYNRYGEEYNLDKIKKYCWYKYDGDWKEFQFNENCSHTLHYFTKDNVCHPSMIYDHTFLVDDALPDYDMNYPRHGYYDDAYGNHLKTNATFTINAYDLPNTKCKAGIETIFFRYEWDTKNYPENGNIYEYDIINGSKLVDLYGEDYNTDEITEYWWFRVNKSVAEIWFEEQCYHELYFFIKDNLCHRTKIQYRDYYVDDTPPDVSIREYDLDKHGYYYNETEEKGYIKAYMHFNITAVDCHECSSDIETIFFRYKYDNKYYPPEDNIYGYDTIAGTKLVDLYGEAYNNSDMKPYTWFRINSSIAELWFEENCTHDLYYFAKDNVCNPSDVFSRTFYVDNVYPSVDLCVTGHGWYNDTDAQKEYLRVNKSFYLNAWDNGVCKAGIETIFFRYAIVDPTGYYTFYPPEDNVYGYDIIEGSELVTLYGSDYQYEGITEYWWFRVNASTVKVWFEEECEHELWYFAKDNVCHRTDLKTRTFYVDDSKPDFNQITYPSHGYYDGFDPAVLKCGVNITLNTYDNPFEQKCAAGIESLFWRYEYKDVSYPLADSEGAIDGLVLNQKYEYDDPEIVDYWWYYVNESEVNVSFEEECEHTLYYWSKDNVCHNSTIYEKIFNVDNSNPYVDIAYPSHGYYYGGGDDFFNDWNYEIPVGGSKAIVPYHQGGNGTYYTPVQGGSMLELKTDGPGSYTNASKDFEMLAGEIIEGWAAFDARDYWPYMDNASVVIRNNAGDIIATPWYCDVGMVGDYGDGPWTYWSWTAPTDGVYTVEFKVTNDQDNGVDSFGLFDMPDTGIGKSYLKCGEEISLSAEDLPHNECTAGIEGVFWRYEWNEQKFPVSEQTAGLPEGAIIVTGEYLYNTYGYTDTDYIGYDWYFSSSREIYIKFNEECEHELYYWAKDNVCHHSIIYNQTFYVDNSNPDSDLTVTPGHGYWQDYEKQYLRVGKELQISAYDYPLPNDNECGAGIESIFYRYEWIDDQQQTHYFPNAAGEGIVNGEDLYYMYGYEGSQYNHYWYRVDDDTAFVSFDDECQHNLIWFVKDNVCHPSEMNSTTFYVDNSTPKIYSDTPDVHGYYYNDSEDKMYMRVGKYVDLHAYDLPENDCSAGIESLFWRYEWNGQKFPAPGETGCGIRSGQSIAENYSYEDTDFIGYNWYTSLGHPDATVYFNEECIHNLYFWAKDNVCHNSTMHHETYYVDNSSPELTIDVGEPNCVHDDCECCLDPQEYCVTNETKIWINTSDLPIENCASGIESIFYRWVFNESEDDEEYMPNQMGDNVRSTASIVSAYGYDDPEILKADYWYYTNDSSVMIQFDEECKHQLFYWAKDNVCHPTQVFNKTFYVDETPPPKPIKEVGEPSVYLGNDSDSTMHDQWLVYPETPICFSAVGDLGCCPCPNVTIMFRIWYLGEWSDWEEYTDCIHLTEGCVHYLEAYAVDCLGNKGPVDNETFWVCSPGGDSGPDITMEQPTWLDGPHCERELHVILDVDDAQDIDEDLVVMIWIPGGRRDAPTLWYDPVYGEDNKYHAYIPIYNYQDGAEITVQALVMDTDGNVEFAVPVQVEICSTIVWDQWMQKGWNKLTLPYGSIACDNSVESVLASINNGNFDVVWYYDPDDEMFPWKSWVYGEPSNHLEEMFTGEEYWVHIVGEPMRFYTDTRSPDVEINIPSDGDEFEEASGQPGVIDVYAYDIETHVEDVYVEIYDQSGWYYNGTGWQDTQIWLDCPYYAPQYYDYYSYGIWTAGHTYDITARAYDSVGCYGEDSITISISEEDCTHTVELEKYVWDNDCKYWAESISADVGETVRFNISIFVPEYGCHICDGDLTDYLPTGLSYVSGSTNITATYMDNTMYVEIDPLEVPYSGGTKLIWNETVLGDPMNLPAGINVYFEFNATIDESGEFNNSAILTTYACDDLVTPLVTEDWAWVIATAENNDPVITISSPANFETICQEYYYEGLYIYGSAYDIDTFVDCENVSIAIYYNDGVNHYWSDGWTTDVTYHSVDYCTGSGTDSDPLSWEIWLNPSLSTSIKDYYINAICYDETGVLDATTHNIYYDYCES